MNIGGQKVPFKSVLRGYWILWKGKLLQGKSNNEIIAEELEKARQLVKTLACNKIPKRYGII